MKPASAMKELTLQNNRMAKWCDTILQDKIEEEAKKGIHWLRIVTDDIPGTGNLSRNGITSYICNYLKQFGYIVSTVNNDKNIDIEW